MSKCQLEVTYTDSLDAHPYTGHGLRQQPPLPPPPPHVINANNIHSDGPSTSPPPAPPLPLPPKSMGAKLATPPAVYCNRFSRKRPVAPLPSIDEIRTAYAWTTLSALYGRALVTLQILFALVDVFISVDDDFNYPRYQRWLLLYSYSVAFVILIAIYVCTLNGKWPPSQSLCSSSTSISNCSDPECRAIAKSYLGDADIDNSSLTSGWSTLRRAYIRRQGLTATGFSLRLAALVYGVATLIYFGFELAVNTAEEQRCVDDISYTLPILAVVFSFLQIHCLFVNAQIKYLSNIGGTNKEDMIRRILSRLLTNDVASQFSFFGKKGKKPYILKIRTVVDEAARNQDFRIITDQQIQAAVSGWLKFAPERSKAKKGKEALSASFYGGAHFCFVHLVATNVVLWLKTISNQATADWLMNHQILVGNITGPPTLSCSSDNPVCTLNFQMYPELRSLVSLRHCLMNSTLGQMWLEATPFLLPLQLQFFAVSAAVFYVMWGSVGSSLHIFTPSIVTSCKRRPNQVDNKGIFVGLLLLVGGVVVLVMYLVLRARPQFTHDSLWVVSGTLSLVLGTAVLATLFGFLGLNRAPRIATCPTPAPLDKLLVTVSSLGPSVYAIGGIVSGAASLKSNEHLLVLAHGALLLVQSALQDVYIGERECRPSCRTGRRVALVLLFSNTALWLLDTFMTGGADSQKPQREFYGVYAWGIITYVAVPLTALYRLHASVRLYELWNRS